jgi:hypothetical protein
LEIFQEIFPTAEEFHYFSQVTRDSNTVASRESCLRSAAAISYTNTSSTNQSFRVYERFWENDFGDEIISLPPLHCALLGFPKQDAALLILKTRHEEQNPSGDKLIA